MNSGTLVLGLINGMIIGLLATGFVLVYKANRFLNLAHAQLGALSALLLAKVVGDWHWNWWLSFVGCIAVGIVTGLLVERFLVSVVRRRSRSPVRLLMLTIGIGNLLLALTFIPALTPKSQAGYPQPFNSHLEVGGVVLTGMSVLTMIAVPILLVALTFFLEWTSIGKQIRAAAGNPDAARLCGISVNRMSWIVWGLAGGLSALSAIFNGPTTVSFNAQAVGPYLLALTMGAAAFGAFVSIPAAVGGGIGLGLVYQIVAAETKNAGTAELAVFGAILLVILVRGRAIGRAFGVSGSSVPEIPGVRVPAALRGSRSIRWAPRWLAVGILAIAVVLPRLPYFSHAGNQFLLVLVLLYALLGVSLTPLVGWAGQISMGNFAIVGIGAFLTARWSGHTGWSLVTLSIVCGAVGAAVMVVVGLPALRVRGLTLAVTTLGLAVIAPDWLYLQHWLGGSTPSTTPVQPPTVAFGLGHVKTELYLYYVLLVVLVLAVVAARSLRRTAAGRVIIAVRDNERAGAAFGVKPATVKLRALALSGFIAATAGVFWAVAWESISPSQFTADVSISILAIPVIGGIGSLGGAVAAAAILYMGTFFIGPHVSGLLGSFGQNEGFLLFFSGIGVVISMVQFPTGIAGEAQRRWQSYLNRKAEAARSSVRAVPVAAASDASPKDLDLVDLGRRKDFDTVLLTAPGSTSESTALPRSEVPLEVREVSAHFGGIAALSGVSVTLNRGEIVGLIGPNGAGKTTLMNVISGALRSDGGSVQLFGTEVLGKPPEARARLGLARSFQDASLFAGLTVTETVEVALATRARTRMVASLLGAPWVTTLERRSRERAGELIDIFGLSPWADALTAELSTGMRRICDLMAQVASGPRVLLLDEPTAGVAQREAEAFTPLVRRIRDDLDCSILVIEHDMPILMGLCDRVYAMETGRVIAEGTPVEIREDPVVIASYLGTNDAAIRRSNDTETPGHTTDGTSTVRSS